MDSRRSANATLVSGPARMIRYVAWMDTFTTGYRSWSAQCFQIYFRVCLRGRAPQASCRAACRIITVLAGDLYSSGIVCVFVLDKPRSYEISNFAKCFSATVMVAICTCGVVLSPQSSRSCYYISIPIELWTGKTRLGGSRHFKFRVQGSTQTAWPPGHIGKWSNDFWVEIPKGSVRGWLLDLLWETWDSMASSGLPSRACSSSRTNPHYATSVLPCHLLQFWRRRVNQSRMLIAWSQWTSWLDICSFFQMLILALTESG